MEISDSTSLTTKLELLGYCITEELYSGSRTQVYRGRQEANQLPVVIKVLKRQYPTFSELVQFRNQYTIAKNLDIPGIIKPYTLEPYYNGYALVMEDFGGISLRQFTQGQPLTLDQFLPIALQLTETLHQLHQQRIIHKDIKPANILIHPHTKQVKLIDFSISTLLPRETQQIQSLNTLEGTLAYLSPEQTGRMNRSVDYRSDFYSLGVSFFELLTGELPFQSHDPMTLVHCHIAKQPDQFKIQNDALYETRKGRGLANTPLTKFKIPPTLADIVIKLMAKNAEDRYQSALGLQHDLQLCWQQLQETGKIADFAIAQGDMSDRFIIPEKLYGREQEVEVLLDAFGRVADGASELMLVTGFSGIGKTAVVNEVHKPIVRSRGYFIKGKYDQFQRNIPLSAFVQAFRGLMGQILSETDAQLSAWKSNILAAVGENGQVLIEVIPELEQIIGKQPPVPELSGSAAQNRFNLLFQKFIQVFSTPEHPLVIFIDDLQWADSASLKLVQLLMSESTSGYLLLIGAYRDNEVSPAHPLMLTLDDIKNAGANINTINLLPLSHFKLNKLVADTLKCLEEYAFSLSKLLYQKTKGNPFFATQFLKSLHQDGSIKINLEERCWQCDITQIQQQSLTDDVVEFMIFQLQRMPQSTQDILKLAACIGNQFDLKTLAIVSELSEVETAAHLWNALQSGLILPQSEIYKFYHESEVRIQQSGESIIAPDSCAYKFLHDRVQQAAYSLIPQNQKQATHLKMGQLLLKNTLPEAIEANIFEIINHFNAGISMIILQSEKEEIAQLNLIAGRKAKASTAYNSALQYFVLGIELLSQNSWNNNYNTTFALYRERAECEYLTGNLNDAETLFNLALDHTCDQFEQADIYAVQMYLKMTQGENIQAGFEAGIKGLSIMGMKLPITVEEQQAAIKTELEEIKIKLANVRPADLFELSEMTDPVKKVCMSLLADLWAAAYMGGHQYLSYLSLLLMINTSLKYGNTDGSGFAYCLYGMSLANQGDYQTAYEFGKLALKLDRHLKSSKFIYKTNNIFAHTINPYNQHLKTNLPLSRQSFQTSGEAGDIVFGVWAVSFLIWAMLIKGDRLSDIYAETEKYLSYVQQVNDVNMLYAFTLQRQFLLSLQDLAKNTDLLDEENDDTAYINVWRQKKNFEHGINWYCFLKIQISYLYGRYEDAVKAAIEAQQTLANNAGFFPIVQYYFYYSLSLAALYSTAASDDKKQYWNVLQQHQQIVKNWADNCPENFLHRYMLLSAEIAKISGDRMEAIELYDRAISAAKEQGYIQEEALANELAAKFYLDWSKQHIAQEYMTQAYYGYASWGAKAKVADLERRYPQLLAPILQQSHIPLSTDETIFPLGSITCTSTATSSSSSASVALDLATILKASQTISGEIELDKLLSALLSIVIENAGADKCVLMLLESDRLMIQASHPILLNLQPVEDSQNVPVSLINTVKRSLQPAVIVDGRVHPQLINDSYIQQQQPKSILCSPILHQGKLLGVLYLENNLTTGAFTSDRVQILNLLCTQAAISLENAQLYRHSQNYAQQLEQSLAKLQESEIRFQNLADNIPGMVYQFRLAVDGSTSTPYVSSGCWELYELEPASVMAGVHSLYAMHHPDDDPAIAQAIAYSVENLTPFEQEWRIILPSGTVKWVQSVARPARQADGSTVWDGVVIDISNGKEAEASLAKEREFLNAIIHNITDGIVVCDPSGKLVLFNKVTCEFHGLPVEPLPPEQWAEYFDLYQADGKTSLPITEIPLFRALQGEIVENAEIVIAPKHGIKRILSASGQAIVDSWGNKLGAVVAMRDISEQKRAELALQQKSQDLQQALLDLQQTQLQMVQSEKMSALGNLVAGVAHEMNNPLGFIAASLKQAKPTLADVLTHLNFYQQSLPHPGEEIIDHAEEIDLEYILEDLPKMIDSMTIACDRLKNISTSLRTFSRADKDYKVPFNIHEGIDSTILILKHRLKANEQRPAIEVVTNYGNLPQIECFPGQLNQVFMNLLANAIDALEESNNGQSFYKIKANPNCIRVTTFMSDEQIKIAIADNGIGMNESVKQKIFDHLFTTKSVGKGTGLGLAIARQIVEETHGGKLSFHSVLGEGTEFLIEIPV
jgi:PAS domain S-box-containing protein